jgi:hypothetical protein
MDVIRGNLKWLPKVKIEKSEVLANIPNVVFHK